MAENNRLLLTRDQLAAFLPDHQAVKQFEDLFKQVSEVTPTEIDYLAALIAGGRSFNSDSLRVEVNQMTLAPPQKQNLNSLENRLSAIEAFLGLQS